MNNSNYLYIMFSIENLSDELQNNFIFISVLFILLFSAILVISCKCRLR